MKSKQNNKPNNRLKNIMSINQLHSEVKRLQQEMMIIWHLHSKDLENLDNIHKEIEEKMAKEKAVAEVQNFINNQHQ